MTTVGMTQVKKAGFCVTCLKSLLQTVMICLFAILQHDIMPIAVHIIRIFTEVFRGVSKYISVLQQYVPFLIVELLRFLLEMLAKRRQVLAR